MQSKILTRTLIVVLCVVAGMLVFAYLTYTDQSNQPGNTNSTYAEPTTAPNNHVARPTLPLPGSVFVHPDMKHTVQLSEITRDCHTRDCFPALDEPVFSPAAELDTLLASTSLGILLSHNAQQVFYPLPMLESRPVVNDTVDGLPVVVTYSPLTGTAAVYQRGINDTEFSFGVSGMLWQANLLLYNRSADVKNRNLWSQILGEAVVGPLSGQALEALPSDIISFAQWQTLDPAGKTLDTGALNDRDDQQYFASAQEHQLTFDVSNSPLSPQTYVYGLVINGQAKAYPKSALPVGVTIDEVAGQAVQITKSTDGRATFAQQTAGQLESIVDTETFWFAWKAARPGTVIWDNK